MSDVHRLPVNDQPLEFDVLPIGQFAKDVFECRRRQFQTFFLSVILMVNDVQRGVNRFMKQSGPDARVKN